MTILLYIGNKNYPLVLRPWIGLRTRSPLFDEKLVPLTGREATRIQAFSTHRQGAVLVDGDITVWNPSRSLINVARKHPASGLWDARPIGSAKAMPMELPRWRHHFPALRLGLAR